MMGIEIGIFAASLLWLALLMKLTARWLPRRVLWGLLVLGIVSCLIPFKHLLIGGYIFALTSYLSITSMLLLVAFVFARTAKGKCENFDAIWSSQTQWSAVCGFAVLSGLLLYPMTAGLTLFDPYRLGYLGTPLSGLLVVYLLSWTVLSLIKGWYLLLALILVAVLAYYVELLPTHNLWDYVIDPLFFIYSLFVLLKLGACRLFKRSRSCN